METSTTATRTYWPNEWALLPGSAARAVLIGILHVPLSVVLFAYLDDATKGTSLHPFLRELYAAIGVGGIMAAGFVVPIAATLLLAFLGYARRRYEFGADGITERRGILLSSETHLPYDAIEEVIFTQSRVQSWYGAGTIRLIDVDADDEDGEVMRFRFISNPEAVYTNVLRNIADVTGSTAGERDVPDVGEAPMQSEDLSRVSGDTLAAGTGFQYLMPGTILKPEPWKAAKSGALLGVGYALLGAAVLVYLLESIVLWLVNLPPELFPYVVALGGVGQVIAMGSWYYWTNDRIQYELYDDHVRLIEGGERSSVSLDDVADVERREGIVSSNDVGHVALVDEDGDELLAFRFVSDLGETYEKIDAWIASKQADGSADPSGTPEGTADSRATPDEDPEPPLTPDELAEQSQSPDDSQSSQVADDRPESRQDAHSSDSG